MAYDDDSQALDRAYQPAPGLGVAVSDPVQNPGLPPHRARMTDQDPKAEKRAARTVYTLFYLSLAGSIWAISRVAANSILFITYSKKLASPRPGPSGLRGLGSAAPSSPFF